MNCLSNSTWPEFIRKNFSGIRKPFSAGIEIWPECNFRCVHCYAESDRKNSKIMSTDEIYSVIDILEQNSCIDLFLTGGEVLLHKDFINIYKYAKSKGMLVSVLTNGSLIRKEHIELWKMYPPELISITMYAATEDTYKKITKNNTSLINFKKGVNMLKDNNIPFEIKCIGMTYNYGEISDIRNFIYSLGKKNSILAWDIRPMNNGEKEPINYRLTPLDAFMVEITDKSRREFWNDLAVDPNRSKFTQRQSEGYLYPCAIADQFVFIASDGYMQGCVKERHHRYDLLNGNFDDGWDFLKKELVDKKASSGFVCLKCDKFKYCGQCTAAFEDENGDPEKPVRFYCEYGSLLKKYMDNIK